MKKKKQDEIWKQVKQLMKKMKLRLPQAPVDRKLFFAFHRSTSDVI
jgi:hypothetical protein